ncbi:hypothetical protein GH714_023410 [Hevea brasiliensis]|uniref:Uncharacterized protein n=1 Tax=Hevea brasiliensis TaxID=3981 RepID=A0A6A6M9K0_HEVBR|nr:hypothetical protein GH714_023410 [Hevea brasiliensis]
MLKQVFANYLDMGDGFLARRVESIKDSNGRTALHCAAEEEILMENSLHCAILHGRYHTAVYVINLNDSEGCRRVLQLLISNGAEIDAQADSGTPLQEAASRGMTEAVKILLDNANPNMTFRHLFSPLVKSIEAGSFECVKQLLKAGADPNMRTVGPTPLEYAASLGDAESIKYLLDEGALTNVTSNLGLTPVEVAARNSHHEAVKILLPFTSPFHQLQIGAAPLEQRKNKQFLLLKSKGNDAFKREDYNDAIYWYTEAEWLKPMDAEVKSNRSLCWARLNEGYLALADGQRCVLLKPKWPKSHYREGMGWKLLEDLRRQRIHLILDGGTLAQSKFNKLLMLFWSFALKVEIHGKHPRSNRQLVAG